jgi:hypothetical protein
MAARANRHVLYRERPRCPPWVYLGFFLVPACVLLAGLGVIGLLGGGDAVDSTTVLVVLVICAPLGALPWFSQRPVVVDATTLMVGRSRIPLASISATRPVEGAELRKARHEIAHVEGLGGGSRGSLLGSGIGMMADGVTLIETEDRRRGMHCSAWQEPAILVETPSLPTKRWLIAARDPLRLGKVIQGARPLTDDPAADRSLEEAMAALPPIEADEGGWLPPPRER